MVKRCLVLGSANCLRTDIAAALAMSEFDGVIAAKGAGLEWKGELEAWVSLHPERFRTEIAIRRELGYPAAQRTYGHKAGDHWSHTMDYKFVGQKRSGSSGLFACKVAIELGFNRLVLCGMPLDKDQGRIDGKAHWNGASSFKAGFEEALPHLRETARSMSGWTKSRLGLPTPEWLEYKA